MKPFLTVLAALFTISTALAERVEHLGCYAEWSETEIIVGNALVERKWTVRDGLLTASSLRDKTSDTEWLRQPGRQPAPYPGGEPANEKRKLAFTTEKRKLSPVEEECLLVKLVASGVKDTFTYQFQIFPKSAGVNLRFSGGEAPVSPTVENKETQKPDGIEQANMAKPDPKKPIQALEDLMLAPQHLRYTQVELKDQTDHHDELVFEREWLPLNDNFEVACNMFHVENPMNGNGLIFLKVGPLPHARPVKSPWDIRVAGEGRRLTFVGSGYPWTVVPYQEGRAGRIAAMQNFQRCLRQYQPQRDGMFLSNTWGDRNRDSRISEEFLLKEVEAGSRLGVDVVQVDDGWQKGKTGNSAFGKGAWGNFRSADPEFWKPHPERFPNGLKPLVDAAKQKGMKFGLWFGPDAENDMANWEKDADMLLSAFDKEGVEYVKIDAVEMTSPAAEVNLDKFYNKVLEKTQGRVVFDADATAGLRPGYFGSIHVGPIFLENRYTDWKRYWPHHTLRNLWTLGEYVDPVRLRMEFLNQTRHADKYKDDPLAPANYPPDTLFASVMFASPLGWFEVSNLPDEYFKSIPNLVSVWKKEREAIFSGSIIPIGQVPDGHAWTGFSSVSQDRKSARLVIFRELNQAETWSTEIPLLTAKDAKVTILGGKGSATYENGTLKATIPDTLQYVFLKVE
ncbi:MAG: alpha-galactosidase [Akkermansiaceae bacterium]|jgi:alpha-galactosidase|nr:alpha-galactosidase [Luteolibacter sp.]